MHIKHNLYNTKDLGFYYFSHLTEEPEGLGLLTQSYRASEKQIYHPYSLTYNQTHKHFNTGPNSPHFNALRE